MSTVSLLSSLYANVQALKPLVREMQEGRLSVSTRQLPPGMKAVYAPSPGTVPGHAEVQDEVVLSDREEWSRPGLWQRSIMVHEGYHARDDMEGTPKPHLESEAKAWTGQAAYLIEELGQAGEDAWESLFADLSKLSNLERMSLAISAANVKCSGACSATQDRLKDGLVETLTSFTGVESALKTPEASLPQALWLIYGTSRETKVNWDGIGPKV